jgi:secreted trypsin-like serine protease
MMTKWNFRKAGYLLAMVGLVACSKGQNAALNATDSSSDGRIIGGMESTGKEDFAKSIVSLYDVSQGALCTASILSDSILVTAAHCVDGADPSDLRIIYGVNLESRDIVVRGVDSFLVSPLWAARQGEEFNTGDIAVVHFSGGLVPGFVPATVLTDLTQLKNGDAVLLAGYGISDGVNQTGSGHLRFVETTIRNTTYSKTEILVDQTQGKGACHGDSGGPAYAKVDGKLVLWGVTSRGVDDPNNDCSVAAAYTAIPFYSQWVTKAAAGLNSRAARARSNNSTAPAVAAPAANSSHAVAAAH